MIQTTIVRKVRAVRWRKALARGALIAREFARTPALGKTALIVRRQTGKSLGSQAREIVRFQFGPGRLRGVDYYGFGLYDDRRYTLEQKAEFVSWTNRKLSDRLNDRHGAAICGDKLLSYALFAERGLPYPEILSLYHPDGRSFGSVPTLRTPEAMAEHLRVGMRYPFFGKPIGSGRGSGASLVRTIDRERDRLVLADGTRVEVEEYVRTWPAAAAAGRRRTTRSTSGYLFQSLIEQHPCIDELSGGRVSTLRLVVLLWPEGPRVFRVTWKLPVGNSITDHVIGTSSNIKCSIDPATGVVEQVLQGLGPEGAPAYGLWHHGRPVDRHPDTGRTLMGVQLPYWDRTVATCLRAASALPGVRYQSWDVAMGVDGPLLVEVNSQGGVLQVPGCKGFNDAELRAFLAAWGLS